MIKIVVYKTFSYNAIKQYIKLSYETTKYKVKTKEISVLPVLHLSVFLFQTMFSLQVILFIIVYQAKTLQNEMSS